MKYTVKNYSDRILFARLCSFINKHQRIPKRQSKKDNSKKLATQGTQDEEKHNENTTQYMFDTKPYSLIKYILTDF